MAYMGDSEITGQSAVCSLVFHIYFQIFWSLAVTLKTCQKMFCSLQNCMTKSSNVITLAASSTTFSYFFINFELKEQIKILENTCELKRKIYGFLSYINTDYFFINLYFCPRIYT